MYQLALLSNSSPQILSASPISETTSTFAPFSLALLSVEPDSAFALLRAFIHSGSFVEPFQSLLFVH